MLDAMRKRANSWFVRALLLVLIASFAVWGIGDLFLGRQDVEVAATVGDIEVPLREVDRAFENDRQALSQQLGVGIDRQQAASFGLLNRSVQSVVARALVDQHRQDLGLGVSDAEVAAAVRTDPFFQSAGSFDRLRFDGFLRQAGLSEAQYIETVRRDIGRNRILTPMRALTAAPAPLAERLGLHRAETRRGTLLVVPRAEMAVGDPDDAALRALLEEEEARFTAPEFREVSLVTLTTETLIDEIEIEAARLMAEYEARIDFYTRAERRRAGQLLARDQAVIEAAAAALAEGAVFADLATVMAADGLTYSTLGPTTAADLPPEFAEPIFALDEGAVSEPVESLFGWHLFRVIDIEPAAVQGFDEVRDDIRRDLALDTAIDQLPGLAAALDDEIAAGASLEDAAGTVGVELRHFAAIDATGSGPDGRPVPEGPSEEIRGAIFQAPVGEVSLLEETADGSFYMFRINAVQEPQRRALEDVSDDVADLWRQREQDRAAAERVEEIMADARAGRTLEAIAAALGGEVILRSFEPVRRSVDGAAQRLTPEAVATLFRTKAGELAREPVAVAEGVAILRTDAVMVPDASAAAEVAAELEAGMTNDILAQYEAALRARYPVQVNDAAIASLFPAEEF